MSPGQTLSSHHILLEIPQHPQFPPIRAAHTSGSAATFFSEAFAQGLLALENRVDKLRRAQHRAIAEVAYSVTQSLTHRHGSTLLAHGFNHLGLDPSTPALA